ncbi:GNAT family N-acetyltransferase [Sedimentitalea todarodis]|uniref:GNAT family N-acetyltransferase n=1 Tax=Sedimentitalea todarodis TaxID=1631240 RepID=A0ABU3V9L7_9RHOB|nr:GNAT family N-acetyltransferase [Sedimentitalea todarodis]MDU9002725.1 GNAT family N-acetyltransferase [Sedimentitalea todarodis]
MLTYDRNTSTTQDILTQLTACDSTFSPPLSTRTDLQTYAAKLHSTSDRFEAWEGTALVGLVAAYCNAPDRGAAFVTSVSVLPEQTARGIAARLMSDCIAHAADLGFTRLELEVSAEATAALRLYERLGFALLAESPKDEGTLHLIRALS